MEGVRTIEISNRISEHAPEIRYEDETIRLTQKMMAALYDVTIPTINEHVKTIFNDDELDEGSTVRKFRTVQKEGDRNVSRDINHYSLQAIIAVGFKVNNERAVQNKLHYAIHGHTAAEVIVERADAAKEHMGLTSREGAPNGKIHTYDVVVAKNYLSDHELGRLGTETERFSHLVGQGDPAGRRQGLCRPCEKTCRNGI